MFRSILNLFRKKDRCVDLEELVLRIDELEKKVNMLAQQIDIHSNNIMFLASEIEDIRKKLYSYEQDIEDLYWRTRRSR